jgi:hypothetical protein
MEQRTEEPDHGSLLFRFVADAGVSGAEPVTPELDEMQASSPDVRSLSPCAKRSTR